MRKIIVFSNGVRQRILLRECEAFASEFELTFNATKTQLICFSYKTHSRVQTLPIGGFQLFGNSLSFSDTVIHLDGSYSSLKA